MSEHKKKEFLLSNEADLGYTLHGVGRFRINVFRQRGVVGMAIRRVRSEIPTIEELQAPAVGARSRGLAARAGVGDGPDRAPARPPRSRR